MNVKNNCKPTNRCWSSSSRAMSLKFYRSMAKMALKEILFYGKNKMCGCAGEQELLETRIVSVLNLISILRTMHSQVFQKHC